MKLQGDDTLSYPNIGHKRCPWLRPRTPGLVRWVRIVKASNVFAESITPCRPLASLWLAGGGKIVVTALSTGRFFANMLVDLLTGAQDI